MKSIIEFINEAYKSKMSKSFSSIYTLENALLHGRGGELAPQLY